MGSLIKMKDILKKNILDLDYSKYLQYKLTSIIIASTYFFAVIIAWVTKQLNFGDVVQMSILFTLSIIVLAPCIYWFTYSNKQLNQIPESIKSLNL